jgi:hypothetical protein
MMTSVNSGFAGNNGLILGSPMQRNDSMEICSEQAPGLINILPKDLVLERSKGNISSCPCLA